MYLGSQPEDTLLCIREQSLSSGASQSAVRLHSLSFCTVWPSHSQWPSEQISFITTMLLPILQLSCRLSGKASHHLGLSAPPLQPKFGSLRLLAFPKAKIAFEREGICECDVHTVHKLSQRHLTANWLAPRESDCSLMRSKVSSDWLPSYIKAKRPVLEIFKMAGYFPDSPCTKHVNTMCGTEVCLNVYTTPTAEILMHLQSDSSAGKISKSVTGPDAHMGHPVCLLTLTWKQRQNQNSTNFYWYNKRLLCNKATSSGFTAKPLLDLKKKYM